MLSIDWQDGIDACRLEGHTATVNALAGTHGANVDAVDKIGWTALMLAAWNGHTDTVTALAGTHGANVDAVDNDGWTALMHAAMNGHTAAVNALAGTHGANVDAVDSDGKTALMLAVERGHTDIVNALRACIHYCPLAPMTRPRPFVNACKEVMTGFGGSGAVHSPHFWRPSDIRTWIPGAAHPPTKRLTATATSQQIHGRQSPRRRKTQTARWAHRTT